MFFTLGFFLLMNLAALCVPPLLLIVIPLDILIVRAAVKARRQLRSIEAERRWLDSVQSWR